MSNKFRVRPMKGHEETHLITSNGMVFRKTRIGGKTNKHKSGFLYTTKTLKGNWLKLQNNANGYKHINIGTNKITRLVHRLVAETFIPNPNNKPHINHIDADRTNNNVSNLEWCTPSENIAHAYSLGRMNIPRFEDRHNAKLDRGAVDKIRELWLSGNYKQKELATLYGVDASNISRIVNNKWWRI